MRKAAVQSNSQQQVTVIPVSKKYENRVTKPRNLFHTTSVFPKQLTEDCCAPQLLHLKSESYLSTSSSVWDTDCLVAADPKTAKIPSVLVKSARNELNCESDQTEDLLTCDPYFGLDLPSRNSKSKQSDEVEIQRVKFIMFSN